MVSYLNPNGHDLGPANYDGYGISLVIFIVIYTVLFLTGCAYLWHHRDHPIIRMRKIGLALLSVLILHVYLFMVMMAYPLNGLYPCNVEFWAMSLYLPIGLGLFQAQNQQLLLVSRGQDQLMKAEDSFKRFAGERGHGLGTPRYWANRCRLWWNGANKQRKYESFVLIGIVFQFLGSLIIYNISQKFSRYGTVGHPSDSSSCRRGWEWAPSIIWQFSWNYFFGPYLIYRVRLIRDIYHWRVQTVLAIVASMPGTPLWLVGTYTDAFNAINKYWPACMWFAPGLITIELTTLIFPIYQIYRHQKVARETSQALAEFDAKQLKYKEGSETTSVSTATRSTGSKGKMYSMETLEHCIHTNCDGLQVYASCMELNGENIVFLTRVIKFKRQWRAEFTNSKNAMRTRTTMFRAALSIFVNLVHSETATYPINIESNIYRGLELMFREATQLVACQPASRNSSTTSIAQVTPWAEPGNQLVSEDLETFQLGDMKKHPRASFRRLSSEDSVSHHSTPSATDSVEWLKDPLNSCMVPQDFDAKVFDAAFKSIKYMVWSETWQRFMNFKKAAGVET